MRKESIFHKEKKKEEEKEVKNGRSEGVREQASNMVKWLVGSNTVLNPNSDPASLCTILTLSSPPLLSSTLASPGPLVPSLHVLLFLR